MKILALEVVNFRGFRQVRFQFGEGIWLVYGPNGTGKTTLLEAIAYLSIPRSFRGTRDADLVRWDAEGFALRGEVEGSRGRHTVRIQYTQREGEPRKTVWLDGKRIPSFKALIETFVVLSYTPDDLAVLTGERGDRRRFMDRMMALFRPDYYPLLIAYHRALKRRNLLLRRGRMDSVEERAYRRELLDLSERIQQIRREVLEAWGERFEARWAMFASREGPIRWAYRPALPAVDQDRRARTTTWGAHRDHYEIRFRDREVQAVLSHAQLNMLLLAMFLAWVDLFRKTGRQPVLVVDELLAVLSEDRLDGVLAALEGAQVFLSHHRDLPGYRLHRIPLTAGVGVGG